MGIEETIKKKMEDLIALGKQLKIGDENNQAFSQEHINKCSAWLTSAMNIVQQISLDKDNAYFVKANSLASQDAGWIIHEYVGEMSEVLVNLLNDIELGLISSLIDRTRAETFDNFLDHAKSYLSKNMKNESGVIAGVVFEDSLRRICRKNGIEEKDINVDSLISELQKKNIITSIKAKGARVAAGVRQKQHTPDGMNLTKRTLKQRLISQSI